jgi:rhamnosyltransferase subunit B
VARVLLGWELGAYRGHIEVLNQIAARLLGDGHHVAMAVQQVDASGISLDPRIELWQAPLWPRLLGSMGGGQGQAVVTMGDIIGRMGLDRPGCLAAMVGAWDRIIAAVQPNVIVADYAPALLCAAKGRVRSVSVGPGFCQPPAGEVVFAHLYHGTPIYEEEALLDIADADLVSIGRAPLPSLPALFAADEVLVSSFAELDPYGATRDSNAYCAPLVKAPLSQPVAGGDELFVYAYPLIPADSQMWDGLVASKAKVRIHMFDATPAHRARFAKAGFIFEGNPLPLPLIAARSVMTLSYGGHGFTCASLLAGLPTVTLSFDLEKWLTGEAVSRAGLGLHARLSEATTDNIAELIETAAGDKAMAKRVAAAAQGFHARMLPSLEDKVAAIAAMSD